MIGLNELDPGLLTVEQAAKELGHVSIRTVYRLIARGQLTPIRHMRRTYVQRAEVEEYLDGVMPGLAATIALAQTGG